MLGEREEIGELRCNFAHAVLQNNSSSSFVYFTGDKPKTEVMKLKPDVNREREGNMKRKQSQRAWSQVEDPNSDKQAESSLTHLFSNCAL